MLSLPLSRPQTEGCDLRTASAQRQTLAALLNVEALLRNAGSAKDKLVEVQLSVSDVGDLEEVSLGWREWAATLGGALPCKSVSIGPSGSGQPGCRVEVRAVAKA